ncbi:YitT family protein [Ammoniphilus sp. 3BR4]|uniref:YitT family protein n=1 Tax=Ammoniphilus sp. 3BR4 TaxID=3158265 RepID=UPI003466CE34
MDKWVNLLVILLGSAIMAFGINYFNMANGIAEGGVTGIAILLKYLFDFDLALTNLVLNLPLFYLVWKYFGKIPFLYTIYGNLSVSIFLYLFRDARFPMDDVLLASLFAGLSVGIGLGLVLRYGGTTGGTDILAQLLQRQWGWPVGKSLLVFDIIVIALSLLYLDKERAMYTIRRRWGKVSIRSS